MSWTRIHRTVGGNGQITVRTGHSSEIIYLLNWSSVAAGTCAYTSPIDIPIKGDILVLCEFSTEIADGWVRIEHSEDGTEWHSDAQNTTSVKSITDPTAGEDISKLTYVDASAVGNSYYFLYDIETHGMAKNTRFGFCFDAGGTDLSATRVNVALMPHNF